MSETDLRILPIPRHTSSCCPAIMVSPNGEDLVIVGSLASALLASASVQKRVGAEEAAVVNPQKPASRSLQCNVIR